MNTSEAPAERADALARGESETALLEAGMLLASEVSLPAVLQRLVEIAVEMTQARYGALGVIGAGGAIAEFITVGLSDEERAAIGPIPRGRGILGALIQDPRPLRLARLQDDPRSVGFPAHHPAMTTFLGSPVRARGKVFGNLYLTEKRGDSSFDGRDEAAVVTLAAQAGVAIANAQTYRELQRREGWLEALHHVAAALLAGQPASVLMSTIVNSARELAQADLAAIALPTGDRSSALRVVAAAGPGADRLLQAPARSSGTLSHQVLRSGEARTARAGDVDLSGSLVAGSGSCIAALMVVPLWVGGKVGGTISLTLAEPSADFAPSALPLLQSFADQASLALDYARSQARSLQLAVVEERNRIARYLHDEPVQALIHLARRLEGMATADPASRASATSLEETRELAVAVVDGLRQLTEGLRSEVLERDGLAAALRDLSRRFTSRTGLLATFSSRKVNHRWDPALERDLLRLAQEALSNVERHASARTVGISLSCREEKIRLRISDDGVGFVIGGPDAVRAGLGTIGMRERVEMHQGTLEIRSRPGQGTSVVAVVPDKTGAASIRPKQVIPRGSASAVRARVMVR